MVRNQDQGHETTFIEGRVKTHFFLQLISYHLYKLCALDGQWTSFMQNYQLQKLIFATLLF